MTKFCKRLVIAMMLLCLNVGMFTMVADAASKLNAPEITLSNVASSGKIKISWGKVKNAVSYKVYRSTDGESWTRISTTKNKSITNTSAVSGKTYYYKVRAIASKSSRNSEYSEVKSLTCDLKRPTISISGVSESGKNKISWKAISKAVGYEVYRSTDAKNWELLEGTEALSYTDISGVAGQKYYYKVKAIAENEDANSALSTYKYRTCDLARPVIDLDDDEDTGKIVVSWEPIEGAKEYQIYRGRSTSSYSRIKTTADTSYVDTGASVGKKYYYKVKAISSNSSANSAYSSYKYRTCKGITIKSGIYYVKATQVTLYKSASSSSSKISVPYMAEVEIVAPYKAGSDWYKVYYKGNTYYVWLPKLSEKFTTEKSDYVVEDENVFRQEVVDLAVEIATEWDTEYAHKQSDGVDDNGNGKLGFDCSGFASYVLNTVMRSDGRVPTYRLTSTIGTLVSMDYVYNAGVDNELKVKDIELEDIQPGDIIFFSLKSKNDHCGIYLGNGEFAHSSSSWSEVCIMPFDGMYMEKLSVIRRFIPEEIEEADTVVTIDAYSSSSTGCYMYKTFGNDSTSNRQKWLKNGAKVTVIFGGFAKPGDYSTTGTSYYASSTSASQAYVEASDGTRGFVYTKNLKK